MTTVPLKEDNILMLQKVIDFPSQLSVALNLEKDVGHILPGSFSGRISAIVVAGMGASGVIGDFIKVLLKNSTVPIYVHKDSSLPAFVDEQTLVISITYSGKTRETLELLNASIESGAKNLVVTSSNDLGLVCSRKGISWIAIPNNDFPRASLGFMLVSVLDVLHDLGLTGPIESDIEEAISILREIRMQCSPDIPDKSNPAKLLAHALVGRVPIIYSESGFTDVAALRWKQQINENAKAHCYHDVFPELLHNEVESWHLSDGGHVKDYALLLLRDAEWERSSGLTGKIEATKDLAESKGAKVYDLWTRGKSEFARLMSLCYVGDFVSVYLALSRGIDPGPVNNIEQLKKVSISNKGI